MIAIRAARPDDHDAYTRLFAELGVPDPVPSAESFATAVMPRMWIAESVANDVVASGADAVVASGADAVVASGAGTADASGRPVGRVVGYITWRAYGETAHVVQLAVDPAMRGQRIGELLLEHVRSEARAAGCTRWYLNVKRDNAPALRLYERVGFAFELESVAMKLDWARVPPGDVRHRLADAGEDAAIAARFGMPAERVRTFRSRGVALVTLRDEADAITGFAAFDPSYPGAATFCATQPELAVALLAAMRAHADPAFDFVRLTVEGDRPLVDAVLALGAELTFEIVRLGGSLEGVARRTPAPMP